MNCFRIVYLKKISKYLFTGIISICLINPITSNAAACFIVSAASIRFGQYNPLSAQPTDIDTTIEFYCPPAFQGKSILATVQLYDSGNLSTQSILNTTGPGKLDVDIYIDTQRSQLALSNTFIPIRDFNSETKTFRVTLYGRIASGQNQINVGQYFGKLSLLLSY